MNIIKFLCQTLFGFFFILTTSVAASQLELKDDSSPSQTSSSISNLENQISAEDLEKDPLLLLKPQSGILKILGLVVQELYKYATKPEGDTKNFPPLTAQDMYTFTKKFTTLKEFEKLPLAQRAFPFQTSQYNGYYIFWEIACGEGKQDTLNDRAVAYFPDNLLSTRSAETPYQWLYYYMKIVSNFIKPDTALSPLGYPKKDEHGNTFLLYLLRNEYKGSERFIVKVVRKEKEEFNAILAVSDLILGREDAKEQENETAGNNDFLMQTLHTKIGDED